MLIVKLTNLMALSLKDICWKEVLKLPDSDEIRELLPCDLLDFYKDMKKINRNNVMSNLMDSASEQGLLDVIKYLRRIKTDHLFSTWAIDLASKNGHLHVVKYLYSIHRCHTTNAISWATENGHLEIADFLKKDYYH